jgi:biotin carboxyl carrier protein
MKLRAAVADYLADVGIYDSGTSISAEVSGNHYELEVRESSGGYLLSTGGKVFECRIEGQPESGQSVTVIVGTASYLITLTDPKRLRGASSAAGGGHDVAKIVAPMPGKVVRVLVEVGDQVEVGAGLVVVEAMKMQNELKSTMAGTVVAINVSSGATVNSRDVLAVVE